MLYCSGTRQVRCRAVAESRHATRCIPGNLFPLPLTCAPACTRGAGSALLQKADRLEAVMRGVSSQLSMPVTFKLRTGYTPTSDIAHTLLAKASQWGPCAATLHGRSRQQR